jgi:hypothetical protein
MGNNEKSLVDLYPELFEIQPNDFFANVELDISSVVKATIPLLENKAKDYAMETIVNPKDNPEAVEECKNRYIDGACWYTTNVFKLKALEDKELKRTLKAAREIYSRNYCETVPEESDYSKEDALNLKEVLEEDFGEGVKWAAFMAFCKEAEGELEKDS